MVEFTEEVLVLKSGVCFAFVCRRLLLLSLMWVLLGVSVVWDSIDTQGLCMSDIYHLKASQSHHCRQNCGLLGTVSSLKTCSTDLHSFGGASQIFMMCSRSTISAKW